MAVATEAVVVVDIVRVAEVSEAVGDLSEAPTAVCPRAGIAADTAAEPDQAPLLDEALRAARTQARAVQALDAHGPGRGIVPAIHLPAGTDSRPATETRPDPVERWRLVRVSPRSQEPVRSPHTPLLPTETGIRSTQAAARLTPGESRP